MFWGFCGKEKEVAAVFWEIGLLALVDQVGVGDNVGISSLTEDDTKAGDGNNLAGDDVTQYIPRTDRGELIYIANQQQMRTGFKRFQEIVSQEGVEHGGFVHDENIDLERVVGIEYKAIAG